MSAQVAELIAIFFCKGGFDLRHLSVDFVGTRTGQCKYKQEYVHSMSDKNATFFHFEQFIVEQ